jgi:predicted signal transduction protein with EAL and GGDEF domain
MCCMFCKSEKVKIINEGLWIIKVMVAALVCLVLRLLVGTAFFECLMAVSEWGANLLYLFIAIVFVDLVYAFDAYLDECAVENSKVYILKAILSITLILTAAFLAFLSFQHTPPFVSWVNVVLMALFLAVALLRVFPGNSILVAALMSVCIFVIGFYIEGGDSEEGQWSPALVVIKDLFVVFLLLGMLCQGSNKLRTSKSTINELLALNTTASEDDNRYVSSNKWTVYHYIMIIIFLTIPAVLFSWKGSEAEDHGEDEWL